MSTIALDRLVSGGAIILDRLVDTTGVPTLTSIGTVRDGSAVAFTGTGFDASGNFVYAAWNGRTIQLSIASEGTTLITSTALDCTGLPLSQPVTFYMTNGAGVQSNAITLLILSKAGETWGQVAQQNLGDPSTRIAASPDITILDEVRFKNLVGTGVTIADLIMNPQGDLVVTATLGGNPSVASVDAAIFDISDGVLGPYKTQSFIDPGASATVLEVRGQTQAAANATEVGIGLATAVLGYAQSTIYGLNFVAAQFPSAGLSLPLGGVVELTLSLGATGVLAPTLLNLTQADADATRIAIGIIGTDYRYIDGVNSGLVINQSIQPGQPMQLGDSLDVVVSSNLEPSVINLLMQNGIAILQSANLVVAPLLFANSVKPSGTILAQSPPADSVVAPGDTVFLTVSIGSLITYLGVSGPEVSRDPTGILGAKVSSAGVSGPSVSRTGSTGGINPQGSWTADSTVITADTNKYLADGTVLH